MCIILASGYNDIKFNNLSSRVIVFTDLLEIGYYQFPLFFWCPIYWSRYIVFILDSSSTKSQVYVLKIVKLNWILAG